MPPEIILGRDDDAQAAAAELLDLAGDRGRVEVRTGRSGPAFEVDDDTYDRWSRKHDAGADEQAANAAARVDAEHQVVSDDELPDAARNADPATVDVGVEIASDDEVPAAAVNADPPANGESDAGDDQAAEQPAPRSSSRTRASKSTTRSRSGSGE